MAKIEGWQPRIKDAPCRRRKKLRTPELRANSAVDEQVQTTKKSGSGRFGGCQYLS